MTVHAGSELPNVSVAPASLEPELVKLLDTRTPKNGLFRAEFEVALQSGQNQISVGYSQPIGADTADFLERHGLAVTIQPEVQAQDFCFALFE